MGVNMVKVVDNSQPRQSYEEKRYLVCIEDVDGMKDWAITIGRTATYEYIKENIEIINFDESFVLVETLKLADRKSIYSFMKYVQDNYNDGFDIDDYVKGDFDEDDFIRNSNQRDASDIEEAINTAQNQRLNMQQFMNGEIKSTSLN